LRKCSVPCGVSAIGNDRVLEGALVLVEVFEELAGTIAELVISALLELVSAIFSDLG
jgi:hypothetical protein